MKLEQHIDRLLRSMFGFDKSTNISAEDLKRVDVLSLENLPIKTINDVINMPHLKALNISGTNIQDISVLSNCIELEKLAFHECRIDDLSVLQDLHNLKEIYFNAVLDEDEVRNISHLEKLELLDVHLKTGKLDFLSELLNIKYLHVSSKKIDLSGIECLGNLEYLELDTDAVENWDTLKSMSSLKEVVYLNVSNKEKILLSNSDIEVNEVSESQIFDPVFTSCISRFTLDSGLKQDALDMAKAFSILSLVFFLIIYAVLIFDNEIGGFWDGTLLGLGLFGFLSLITLWMYSMHFEMEFSDDDVHITRFLREHTIPFSDIELVLITVRTLVQSKIKIITTNHTYRLTSSVFVSTKSLKIALDEFRSHGIETRTIRKS